MKKKLQVFVSSTYTDLKEERQAAVEAILKSGNIPAGMELFTAGDKSQLETITRWIDDSDVYMLILGGRYGSIEPATGNSYTEVEYDYAKSNKKPLFAVVISDKYKDDKVKKYGVSVIEQDNPSKYNSFKEKVLSNISSFFDSPKDIKLAVHETLADLKDRYEFIGWVPGDVENKIQELTEENSRLRTEIENLKRTGCIKYTEKNDLTSLENDDEEFEKLFSIFQSIEVDVNLDGNKIKRNINDFVDASCEYMITGVYNRKGMTQIDAVLFYNVMPKLNLYGLTEIEQVSNVAYRRFFLTNKGKKYVLFLKNKITQNRKSLTITDDIKGK